MKSPPERLAMGAAPLVRPKNLRGMTALSWEALMVPFNLKSAGACLVENRRPTDLAVVGPSSRSAGTGGSAVMEAAMVSAKVAAEMAATETQTERNGRVEAAIKAQTSVVSRIIAATVGVAVDGVRGVDDGRGADRIDGRSRIIRRGLNRGGRGHRWRGGYGRGWRGR